MNELKDICVTYAEKLFNHEREYTLDFELQDKVKQLNEDLQEEWNDVFKQMFDLKTKFVNLASKLSTRNS